MSTTHSLNDRMLVPSFSRALLSNRRWTTSECYCLITNLPGALGEENLYHAADLDLEKQQARFPDDDQSSSCSDFAPKSYIGRLQETFPLPPQICGPRTSFLRWTAFSSYKKLFTLVLVLNFSALIAFSSQLRHRPSNTVTYENAIMAASANFCVGILIRNEHVANLLFRVACSVPHWVPLFIRRRVAKVYGYGGLHSGCNVSGTLWYLVFFGLCTFDFHWTLSVDTIISVTTGLVIGFLVIIIIISAMPYMRSHHHNSFEVVHRFLGWSVIACFWTQALLLAYVESVQTRRPWQLVLARNPTFFFLVIITICVAYPWSRLRLRPVQAERLSSQALRLRFEYATMDTCYGIHLTDAPLRETHGFATIPNVNGQKGFSILISAAGDWTRSIIRNPPTHSIWVRGAPTIGVARVALLFRKVLMVATGTGIGPCLSFLQAMPDYPSRVLWSARKPAETYDSETINSVLRADQNAMIIDSSRTGRCDMLALAYGLFKESDAEAVVVISNPKVVKDVVGGLQVRTFFFLVLWRNTLTCHFQARGIPAYGPIFDS